MYSPQINEYFILYLYKEAKTQGIPMTKLVNEIVCSKLLEWGILKNKTGG